MTTINRNILCFLVPVLLGNAACASAPKTEKTQFTQRHYVYTVLLTPEKPDDSPQLDFAMSLVRMEYPAGQIGALHSILYGHYNPDTYKDSVFVEQRRKYRLSASDLPTDGSDTARFSWQYAERFNIIQIYRKGMVIERELDTYSGGAHPDKVTRFYNIENNGSAFKLLTLDDLFANFQEDQQYRQIVYDALRQYSNLGSAQPLSQGGYFSNEPELTFNFFITEEGLGLYWDPAQITPRYYGSIRIVLPWHKIQPLMLYTGIETLAKFEIYLY